MDSVSSTAYPGGGVQTVSQAEGFQVPEQDGSFFQEMAQRIWSEKLAGRRRAEEMQKKQLQMQREAMLAAQNERSRPREAPVEGQQASYVQSVGGPNVVPGYVRSYAGTPGAVYGGWVPKSAEQPGPTHFANAPSGTSMSGFDDLEKFKMGQWLDQQRNTQMNQGSGFRQ